MFTTSLKRKDMDLVINIIKEELSMEEQTEEFYRQNTNVYKNDDYYL